MENPNPKIYRLHLLYNKGIAAHDIERLKEKFLNSTNECCRKYFIKIELEKKESEEKRRTFFSKRLVPVETTYHYTALFDVSEFNENQWNIFNAYALGFKDGMFSRIVYGR